MPRDVTNLWTFVTELDHDSLMAMFTHCVALTVNAVNLPWERKPPSSCWPQLAGCPRQGPRADR